VVKITLRQGARIVHKTIWSSRVGYRDDDKSGGCQKCIDPSPADGGPSWRMSERVPKVPARPGAFFVYGDLFLRLGLNLLLLLGCWSSLLSGRRWRGRFGEIVRKPLPDLCHLE
jgi:hypothetical protein